MGSASLQHTPTFVEILIDGHRILPRLLADLRAATTTIHVSVFLFFRDPIGEEIADVLVEKSRAGVKVRVLLNIEKIAMGDPFSTGEHEMMKHDPNVRYDPLDVTPMVARMKEAGIEVHDTNIDYDRVIHTRDPRLRSLSAQVRETIDVDDLHVDHRKIIVVDGAVAYCGGANLGAQYLFHRPFDPTVDAFEEATGWLAANDPEPWWKWHDSLTRFEGPIATELDEHFHARFVLDGGEEYEPIAYVPCERRAGDDALAVASTRIYRNVPDSQPNEVLEMYLHRIASAERSIFIGNPYLYHAAIVDALCAAKQARPTLRVELVVPADRHNDNSVGQDAQEHGYARLLACGIEIFEYRHHFNHLKIAVFDERYSVHGSTNLNYRSLERDKDFELVVLVDDEAFARQVLAQTRDVDLAPEVSERVTPAMLKGSWRAFRRRVRAPWTLLMLWRKVL